MSARGIEDGHDTSAGAPGDSDEDTAEELAPAEAARDRRRDRDAEAKARAGMGTGLAKQFKQVLDAQERRAREVDRPAGRSRSRERP